MSLCNFCLIEMRLTTLNCFQPNSFLKEFNGRIFINSLCSSRETSFRHMYAQCWNEWNKWDEIRRVSWIHDGEYKGTRGGRKLFTLVAKYLVEHFYVCFLLVVVISYITLPAIITYSFFFQPTQTHTLTRHWAEDSGGCLARIMML